MRSTVQDNIINNDHETPAVISEVGKTALYYEYTLVNVKEDNVIEKTLTALINDPDVTDESLKKVTYYLVQRFFIKSANERKENIDLISEIPNAFNKLIDTVPPEKLNKPILIKYLNLYLSHTISTQEDQVKLFDGYGKVLEGFMQKLIAQHKDGESGGIQAKELVIDQIYQNIDSINSSIVVTKEPSKKKAKTKIDLWINKIFKNDIIKEALDVIVALEDYCQEEAELSKQRVGFLKKYSKLNLEQITKEIMADTIISPIKDAWPIITENIFMYVDNLTMEHGTYKKFLEEVFTPMAAGFVDHFFNHFFLLSAYQKQTEKDVYLIEKTLKDLHLLSNFRSYFTSKILEEMFEDKTYSIEDYFSKTIFEMKGPHHKTYAYLTLKYLLEQTQEFIKENEDPQDSYLALYKKAFSDFIKPKYPKFIDKMIFVYLVQSKDLQKKVGNTKKLYSNIYKQNTALLKNVFTELGLENGFNRVILPSITGFESSNQILKDNK